MRTGFQNLVQFLCAELASLIGITRLEEAAATAATKIVGAVGMHIHKIFLANHGLDNKTQIFSYRIS